jgi:hypothetical protein
MKVPSSAIANARSHDRRSMCLHNALRRRARGARCAVDHEFLNVAEFAADAVIDQRRHCCLPLLAQGKIGHGLWIEKTIVDAVSIRITFGPSLVVSVASCLAGRRSRLGLDGSWLPRRDLFMRRSGDELQRSSAVPERLRRRQRACFPAISRKSL